MLRIGVDFGGTKIEAAALGENGEFLARQRVPNPRAYEEALWSVRNLVLQVEEQVGGIGTVGVGSPGSPSPRNGVVRNANSTWPNGRLFREDLQRVLDRPLRLANDANCLAVSEAADGEADGAGIVFGVIIGAGCCGGLSNVREIYARLPPVIERYVISDAWEAKLAPAKWGEPSGVRGRPDYGTRMSGAEA